MIKKLKSMLPFVNKNILLPIFGKRNLVEFIFPKKLGYKVNFDNPTTFNEKIQVRKLYDQNPLYSLCADKYRVRQYVSEKIGEKYLIPLLFASEDISEGDFNNFPNSFAIKTNHGSHTNEIVFDKEKVNINKIIKKMYNYKKIEFGYRTLELFYNRIKPMIIVEELLLDDNGFPPFDYKFHCFKQRDGFKVFVQVDADRFQDHGRNLYDENWSSLPINIGFKRSDKSITKPKQLDEMITLGKKLAADFEYVRVDFYLCKDKIYFGELTFSHGTGFEKFTPKEWDTKWGGYWKQEVVIPK